MQVSAISKRLQISPQKPRSDRRSGSRQGPLSAALDILGFSNQKAAVFGPQGSWSPPSRMRKTTKGADIDELKISEAFVNAGLTMKRIKPRAKGRADRILKRSSHITVTVTDE